MPLLSLRSFSNQSKWIKHTMSPAASLFGTTSTPYPCQYEMIIHRPARPALSRTRNRRTSARVGSSGLSPDFHGNGNAEPASAASAWMSGRHATEIELDKSKRKYYNKRRKRMYGSDSDDDDKNSEGFVELVPEIVELKSLHKREEELYFYDAFSYPWDKNKHYKMVYQLEKKYFPDQCFDKAFLEPNESSVNQRRRSLKTSDDAGEREENRELVFFEGENYERHERLEKEVKKDITTRRVEELFNHLKSVAEKDKEEEHMEPFLSTRSIGLPSTWDGPYGTTVLINKPKGWTTFTVCGKMRRLVRVKKVEHAGTLDPMATGLLIVCVGNATKLVNRYQDMIKGYSGIFRLGEATSTWDTDSPVIQREPWEHIKDADIKKIAASFCGVIWQVPPMFSAMKVGGEKMYDRGRKSLKAELSPRQISIFQFDVERSLEDRQNLIFRLTCSKGAYIRSLCADFGKALGSCAHLATLRRDSIGEHLATDAWEISELEEDIPKNYL